MSESEIWFEPADELHFFGSDNSSVHGSLIRCTNNPLYIFKSYVDLRRIVSFDEFALCGLRS